MRSGYRIIDEPDVQSWGENLIINPTLILFAAIFIPLFITLPAYGRFWMPLVWLSFNGLALGSSTLRRELLILWLGGVLLALCFYGGIIFAQTQQLTAELTGPYMRIGLFAGFFFILYFAVGCQQTSYELYAYLRGKRGE